MSNVSSIKLTVCQLELLSQFFLSNRNIPINFKDPRPVIRLKKRINNLTPVRITPPEFLKVDKEASDEEKQKVNTANSGLQEEFESMVKERDNSFVDLNLDVTEKMHAKACLINANQVSNLVGVLNDDQLEHLSGLYDTFNVPEVNPADLAQQLGVDVEK